MAYSELIKNFDNIRSYMREFYVYGFKTREEYDKKSARSYDNERRRIQSYLGELVAFRQTSAGRNTYISMDGRDYPRNPLYKAFKSKSFTDKDITLHFIVMDILASGEKYTNKELLEIIESEYLSKFSKPMVFDESTLRKKLKEYEGLGIVNAQKNGKNTYYSLNEDDIDVSMYSDLIRFYTEQNPLGIVGSYIEDKYALDKDILSFKHHYIMNAYDAEIIEKILQGIHEKRDIIVTLYSRKTGDEKVWHVVPMKIYFSTQGGRSYLLGRSTYGNFMSYRLDYISGIELGEVCDKFDENLLRFEEVQKHMWGVTCDKGPSYEHFVMDIRVGKNEEYIIHRLKREKRCGYVHKLNEDTYRFEADVFDAYEMVPWIRTFFGRIVHIACSNPETANRIKADMYLLAKEYEVADDI